jgi:hypothetical protein
VEIDEMHLYIISIKATAGSGLLLTELGKDLLAAYWVVVVPRQNNSCGTIQDKNIERLRTN